MKNFNSEKEMGIHFSNFINRLNQNPKIILYSEYKSKFGIPDFIVVDKGKKSIKFIISIELKLQDWRKALKQAFRYKSFSNLVFIVLDESKIERALNELPIFTHFNIGLASFNKKNELKIYYSPEIEEPFSDYYVRNLTSSLEYPESNYEYKLKPNKTIKHFINRYLATNIV